MGGFVKELIGVDVVSAERPADAAASSSAQGQGRNQMGSMPLPTSGGQPFTGDLCARRNKRVDEAVVPQSKAQRQGGSRKQLAHVHGHAMDKEKTKTNT